MTTGWGNVLSLVAPQPWRIIGRAERGCSVFTGSRNIGRAGERGVLARCAAALGHIVYRSRALSALCCDGPHLIRFISQTKSCGVKFELAGKRYPSKEIIFFAVKCIIGIFHKFIYSVKKERERGTRESFTCCVDWRLFPSDSESLWCTHMAKYKGLACYWHEPCLASFVFSFSTKYPSFCHNLEANFLRNPKDHWKMLNTLWARSWISRSPGSSEKKPIN